jgi:hypothetical protein
MRFAGVIIALAALSAPAAWAQPQCSEAMIVGRNAFAFHPESVSTAAVPMAPPRVKDAEILVELIGLPNFAKVNALRLTICQADRIRNAFSSTHANGFRYIIYDPVWADSSPAEFYLTLSHEVGHHFCEHTAGNMPAPWTAELEADRFGGASIKRFETYHGRAFLKDVLDAATIKYPEKGSLTHPPRALRIEALKKGYETGSACGSLAPVDQRGLSRGIR